MKFKKVTISCSSEVSEMIAYAMHEAGSMGEVFDDYNDIKQVLAEKRWDYADASLFEKSDKCTVSGFFTIEIDDKSIEKRICDSDYSGLFGSSDGIIPDLSIEIIDSAEWENEWKKYYKPFSVGKVVIVPEWEKYTALGGVPVRLNPGLAFGTGTHETTSMCISLMQTIELQGKRVIDFGCGSGILGICAHKLGAGDVIFVDTDEQAVTATINNCALNGIDNPNVLQCDVRNIQNQADVIVANITADVLMDVAPLIKSLLKEGGYAIISGIISSKAQAVVDTYKHSFTYVDGDKKNEWSAYVFRL